MIKKLSKHGNSFAIVLSKDLLKSLHIDETTQLKIESDGKQILIKPVVAPTKKKKTASVANERCVVSSDPKMQKIYEKLAKKYKPALRKLSKN